MPAKAGTPFGGKGLTINGTPAFAGVTANGFGGSMVKPDHFHPQCHKPFLQPSFRRHFLASLLGRKKMASGIPFRFVFPYGEETKRDSGLNFLSPSTKSKRKFPRNDDAERALEIFGSAMTNGAPACAGVAIKCFLNKPRFSWRNGMQGLSRTIAIAAHADRFPLLPRPD